MSGETPGKLAGLESSLKTINAIAAQINPLAGLAMMAIRGVIDLRKQAGQSTQSYEAALTAFQTDAAAAQAAVDEFKAHRAALLADGGDAGPQG